MRSSDFGRLRYDVLAALFSLLSEGRDQPNKNDIEERAGLTEGEVQIGLNMAASDRQVNLIRVDQAIVAASLELGLIAATWAELESYQVLRAIQTLLSPGHA